MVVRSLHPCVLRQLCSGFTTGACAVLRTCGKGLSILGVLAVLLMLPASAAAAPPGTPIANTAQAGYRVGGSATLVSFSNTVTTITVIQRTPSNLELLQLAPTHPSPDLVPVAATLYSDDGTLSGTFTPLPPPHPAGSPAPIDLTNPLPLVASSLFQKQEPIFIRLTDPDQNVDPAVLEIIHISLSVDTSAETEFLRLTETGPDTGIFVGYIQAQGDIPAMPNDGYLTASDESVITAAYTDPADGNDTTAAGALVDPFGIVFDSLTGQPVDGATVTLVDMATGLPATVYADNGVDIYPAAVVSGGTATDSSGRVYNFPPGGYRFPLVTPGTYRLDVIPPSGYAVPSTVPTPQLQSLPGAPYAIADPGSRGEPFVINAGPALHIDLPADPSASGLWLRKTASHDTIAIGDFLQYRLNLQNLSAAAMGNVGITDRLPLGFRYQDNSARRDDAAPVTAAVSEDGRTLFFDIGGLGANTSAEISYVVEVAAGAQLGTAINRASASAAGGIISNAASASVTVKEDLFRSSAIIVGRVTADDCQTASAHAPDGIPGVRIYLEDGTFAITDEHGRYHFEGVTPGTHVVQLDLDTLPANYVITMCAPNNRFADQPHAQFVDLQGGTLWRADFQAAPKPPPQGRIELQLETFLQARHLDYQIELTNQIVPASNLRLNVMLPASTVYVPGSSYLDNQQLSDPQISGNVLIYRLPDMPEDQHRTLHFKAALDHQQLSGEHKTQAVLLFDTPGGRNRRTPVVSNVVAIKTREIIDRQPEIVLRPQFGTLSAQLSATDKSQLEPVIDKLRAMKIVHIYITGHSDNIPIRPRAREIFADNYALALARAHSVERYLAHALDLSPEQTTLIAKGPDAPVADNKTPEGRALNRRVELRVVAEKVSHDTQMNVAKQKDVSHLTTTGAWADNSPRPTPPQTVTEDSPQFDETWLANATPGRTWLWPPAAEGPAIPSTKVIIQHHPQNKTVLMLNGQDVSPLNFDGVQQNQKGNIAISRWRGIDLLEGDNHFEVRILDTSGKEIDRLQRTVHYAGPPIRATLLEQQSHLVADGKTPPVIAVRLVDKDGFPTRKGLVGDFTVDPPFAPLRDEKESQALSLTGLDIVKPHYKVGPDGIAFIRLQPTSQTGEVVLHLPFNERTQELRLWLQPEKRDWILVGLAEGTAGYDTLSGNMENIAEAGHEDGYYDDGRLAFFAKGRIKGKWLLTLAYDSTKDKDQQRLFQTIDPDAYYTLYGDATRQAYDAASREKLYLKIAREQFYALFGDFNTGLTVTQLSRYSRSLTGLKSELQSRKYGFNLFASETDQAFVKDEIRGNGTSGLYRLSRRNLVINSEKVVIETRDRYRSEIILSTRRLVRHLDYTIDYDAGTLFFKEPIFSRDQNFNPIFIVIDYESRDPSDEGYNYGGRGSVKLFDQALEIGATYVHEGQTGGEGDLGGVDLTYDITANTEVKAEIATSRKDRFDNEIKGDAYLAEIRHHSARLDGTAYIREQGTGFGLGQQNGSENSTRKIGLDAVYRFDSKLKVGGQMYRHYNLLTSAERDAAELNGFYTNGGYNLRAGLREASDRLGDGSVYRSTQLLAGIGYRMLDNRLQLRFDHDQSLGNNNADPAYPTRSVLGADYQITSQTALFGEQEFTYGDAQDTQGTRIGLKTMPWAGGQVGSSLERTYNENGQRVLANLGLIQNWQINESWSVSAGFDRSQTLLKDEIPPFNSNVPPAVGALEDFTSLTLGTSYKQRNWSWTARAETRQADTEDKWGFTTGMYVEPEQGLGLSAGAQIFRTDTIVAGENIQGDIRLGVAYRPLQTRWIFLDRLDYIFEKQTDNTFTFDTWRLVNNLNANFKPNHQTQIALQYGLKYVRDRFDSDLFAGFTDLIGIETRYDLTELWDVGIRGSILHSWNASRMDYSAGLSLGYRVISNAWVSVGYNFIGFRDDDFTRSGFTAQGPYIRFRFKFDQESARRALKWFEH